MWDLEIRSVIYTVAFLICMLIFFVRILRCGHQHCAKFEPLAVGASYVRYFSWIVGLQVTREKHQHKLLTNTELVRPSMVLTCNSSSTSTEDTLKNAR